MHGLWARPDHRPVMGLSPHPSSHGTSGGPLWKVAAICVLLKKTRLPSSCHMPYPGPSPRVRSHAVMVKGRREEAGKIPG